MAHGAYINITESDDIISIIFCLTEHVGALSKALRIFEVKIPYQIVFISTKSEQICIISIPDKQRKYNTH